ncbi:elongation factor 2 family protein [Toxoplasma gondii ME49]|uniref:Elongation factor 2 family protein n=1 Tax=Toxoplasma gondii (strain ATCC 50611 / Me49) TaxID=508771 RepID=S8GGS4_TOXGM|nr:elongation factor 2 family protein [Toxoplasma gondii ME49]EPT31050.1 elongation factor 2 family protein [Toxoplasma gondii ME49]|eukprot:XP_002369245.1 elongation factor 2 family protein [Toxoplasma gondii ME49]
MDGANLYDEFGNYIGPELGEDEESEGEEEEVDRPLPVVEEETDRSVAVRGLVSIGEEESTAAAVVPHELKKYYPDHAEVYPEADTVVQEEDTQPITQPIIAPVSTADFDLLEKQLPVTSFSFDYLASLMFQPESIRSVCLLGHLHSGKTTFLDMLVEETHHPPHNSRRSAPARMAKRYTDSRKDEQQRALSIKASPMSLVLQSSRYKNFLFNIFDTPGHVNFNDECCAAMRLCDGAIIVIDALEGVMSNTDRLLRHAVEEQLDIVVVINKLDRLILELRLPPADAYHKIRHTLEEVNSILEQVCEVRGRKPIVISPLNNNVLFAMGQFGLIFSTRSFAKLHIDNYHPDRKAHGPRLPGEPASVEAERTPFPSVEVFEQALWGDLWIHPETRKVVDKPPFSDAPRTFVEFIMEPLYKLVAHVVAEEQPTLQPTLEELGIYLKKDDYKLDSRTLLKKVLSQFFGDASALVDTVIEAVPDPKTNAPKKTKQLYTGNQEGRVAEDMKTLDSESDVLMIYSTKNYHRPNNFHSFDVLGRVMSGTVYKGQRVKVLGEAFSLDDDEDMVIRDITHLWVLEGRYRVEVSHVPAGNWVLIGGVDLSVLKTSTITNVDHSEEVEIFSPLLFNSVPVIKVACEPLQPSELPKMLEALRRIDKSYPISRTRVEESGEHVILGTGEMYLDCVLHDLRKLYGDLELKVADPVVQFCETVVESSALKCFAETPNKKNKIYMLAEPLDKQIGEDIEKGLVSDRWETRVLGEHFTSKYGWDVLAARSIWAFGPDARGPNVLVDDTLPSEVDKNLLGTVRESIVQGFQWATREGPLIEENIRNVKFKILDAAIAADPLQRGGGQVIPTARRVAYSALLLATPRLMEPVYFTEIQCPADCVSAIYTVLARRRGNVSRDMPKPGTPLYIVHAYLPAIESFGFETDLRTHTCGQAFCLSMFDHWAIVPGDPLDKAILLRPLEPAPAPHLAREFLLKTRRRKGLSEDVSIAKFFDDPMLVNIATDLQQFL